MTNELVKDLRRIAENLPTIDYGIVSEAADQIERRDALRENGQRINDNGAQEIERLRACWAEALANVTTRNQEIELHKRYLAWQSKEIDAQVTEIARLRAALTIIKSMATGARQTMIASDILQTARKALATSSGSHEPESAPVEAVCIGGRSGGVMYLQLPADVPIMVGQRWNIATSQKSEGGQ